MPQVQPKVETFARIRVVGVGGAGNSAVNRMIDAGVSGVDFIAVNTDAQALHNSNAQHKIHIGKEVTKGLGAGADPQVGRAAAEESYDEIKGMLEGADMVFVTYGAGGGTGSGGAPIIANIAKDMGILTVGISTKPFAFEGERRRRNAEESVMNLRKNVDTIITIPNDRLLQTIDRKTPLLDAFKVADDVLRQGVEGISNLITTHGMINLDFADVKTVMKDAGSALMGIGRSSGENRAAEAAHKAIESPLLEVSIDGARGVLFNVTGGTDMGMHEINEAAEVITSAVDADANIIFGANMDESMGDEVQVTVIATGFDASFFAAQEQSSASDGLAYFSKPAQVYDEDDDSSSDDEPASNLVSQARKSEPVDADDDVDESEIDMEIEEKKEQPKSEDLRKQDDEQPSDIWSIDDDDEEFERPAFLRRLKRNKDD